MISRRGGNRNAGTRRQGHPHHRRQDRPHHTADGRRPKRFCITTLPASAFADLQIDQADGEDQDGAATSWQPWETAKPQEHVRLTITVDSGEEWSTDDPVFFLAMLEKINLAALQAIRMELATWGFGDLN